MRIKPNYSLTEDNSKPSQTVNNKWIFEKKPVFAILQAMSQTYQPKKKKRARTHGFLARTSSPTGKKVLLRRRRKGRASLTV